MIEHVYERVSRSPLVSTVVIATCDEQIADVARRAGAEAILTSDRHERATDRCQEATSVLAKSGRRFDIAVMVQGDEPMTHPDQIAEVLQPFADDEAHVSNLCLPIDEDDARSADVVKVVMDERQRALYFSRAVIPGLMGNQPRRFFKQLGLIAFRQSSLDRFAELAPTPHEKSESVDMLRFLEHGFPIHMVQTAHKTIAVDTPADLERVKATLKTGR